ncbi:MAG: hypothetical protein ACLGIG_00160 [Actinomycetes bacterium]
MAGFVQIIEYTTSRIDEMRALQEKWRDEHPDMGPTRITVTADRDRPRTYLTIVEFESYEEAMRNNDDPLTAQFAEQMRALTDGPPTFRNLDVEMTEIRMDLEKRARA